MTLQTGDMVEILYCNNGSNRYDQGNANAFIVTSQATVPKPATLLLLGLGLIGLAGVRRKFQK